MFDLVAALAKAIGKADTLKPRWAPRLAHTGKHHADRQRPLDFDRKRKVRRQMAKRSRRINRKNL